MTKKSDLTVDRLKHFLRYEPETGLFYWLAPSSNRSPVGSIAGTVAVNGYRHIAIEGRLYLAHRLAFFYTHGRWPALIDHINRDKADNRLLNLREADKSKNAANAVRKRAPKSGVTGVVQSGRKWAARIMVNGKCHNLGRFEDINAAADAYLAATRRLQGEFSVIRN
jgi:hypothetical protein